MSVYLQLGHHSRNLIFEPALSKYKGVILSPVNYTQNEVIETIKRIRVEIGNYDIVFDPQLYYPRSDREILRSWSYFPNDVDTADLSNFRWWTYLIDSISKTFETIKPNTVCTPVIHPRVFNNDYYDLMNRISYELCNQLNGTGIRVLQTAFVSLSELANYNAVMSTASILTRTVADGIYLIFYSDTNPRRELNDPEELKGGMLLIKTLESNDIRVLVGYTSSDLLLWKESRATSCATGKFFNLRRFTPSRWAETDDGGGGQLPYLFEESLLANLRESDISRVNKANLISESTMNNPYFNEIQDNISVGTPWIALGWRFYLYWFYDVERRINQQNDLPIKLIRNSDRNWVRADGASVILEERQNNGDWVRQWLRAIVEYEDSW